MIEFDCHIIDSDGSLTHQFTRSFGIVPMAGDHIDTTTDDKPGDVWRVVRRAFYDFGCVLIVERVEAETD